MTLEEQIEAILFNWETDVAGLRNWHSVDELHAMAVLRRQKAIESICALLAPTTQPDREGLSALYRHYGISWGEQPAGFIQALIAWATAPRPVLRREELDKILETDVEGLSCREWCEKIKKDIWAWLHGQRDVVVAWCPHHYWQPSFQKWCAVFSGRVLRDDEVYCSPCGKARPTPQEAP